MFMPHTITVCDCKLDFGDVKKGSYTLKASMFLGDTPIKLAISDDVIDQNGYIELCNIEIKWVKNGFKKRILWFKKQDNWKGVFPSQQYAVWGGYFC